ncbi:MAG: DEAD/DEAH box helicase family protein [Bacteroidaceae bacterium]|nr:DEAD/DEAH box helicase family protein [Bacteroidaceae bacterium]
MVINKMNVSLAFAKRLSEAVNAEMESGEMLQKVTPITKELLTFWFGAEHCELRSLNFHEGQRQAILNIIYLHEVKGVHNVLDSYQSVAEDLLAFADISTLHQDKYQMPKYAVKMATGTGKTWVMHALLIWQILNARHEDEPSGRFTKNFLIVAPGLIVYDRLQDAFCGRMKRGTEVRDIQTNDFYQCQELFIPPHFRQEVFSFIQNNVVTKEDGIGKKVTGDGLIALTNWHLFENQMDDEEVDDSLPLTAQQIIDELLPIRPGKAAGNDLGVLDRRALSGTELDYLASLTDLMVINDEAHHIHEIKRNGEVEEVEWQKGLNYIAGRKGVHFFQVDFSATPYDTRGAGEKKTEIYFPHVVVDFDLATAMKKGLVKTLLLDRRQELTELDHLDFKAKRDDRGKVVSLSDGQMLMLRAGLAKLKKLENEFLEISETKNPKMLVICEDTNVSPFVVEFLKGENLNDEDVVSIDSSKKGEVKEYEWKEIKKQLFDIDKYKNPKVIVSVLMLREGFDVNNICIIVPLRSSEASILLEQIIGRGLRLMWREPDYTEIKAEDRRRVLVHHEAPRTYIDTLSIIEHPAFIRFYDELISGGLVGVDDGNMGGNGSTGDMMVIGLKEDYERYDFSWPIIIRDAEKEITEKEIDIEQLHPFTMYSLAMLRKFLAQDGETFVSQEIQTKTQFGVYKVTGDLFTAQTYNEYLQKLLRTVTHRFDNGMKRKDGVPNIQINQAAIIRIIDIYIRTKLFEQAFNPFNGSDWKILLSKRAIVTQHIIKEVSNAIYKMQEAVTTTDAIVEQTLFSSVDKIRVRESYSLVLQKAIYERLGYPSNKGRFEKNLMEFLDRDGDVERFLKINEYQHPFAIIYYIREDGLLATYHPDFIVGTKDKIYLIETKGNDKVNDNNVRRKQKATLQWIQKINQLKPKERMQREWEYILLSEDTFYSLSGSGATLIDICKLSVVSISSVSGNLFFDE